MTLRQKTLLIVGATLLCLLAVLSFVSSDIWSKEFIRIETQQMQQNIERVVAVLDKDLKDLESTIGDWAPWDDSYRFVNDRNAAYLEGNLADDVIANLRLNLVVFINQKGQIVFGEGFDLQQKKATPLPNGLQAHLQQHPNLARHTRTNSSLLGILALPEAPMLIASQPILTSDRSSPIGGTLIFGRSLNAAELRRLSDLTQLSIAAESTLKPLPTDFRAAQTAFSPAAKIDIRPWGADRIAAYTQMNDIYSRPTLLLRVDSPRDIYLEGQRSWRYLMQCLVAVGLVFGVVTLLLLEKLVLSRLAKLSAGVSHIRDTGNLSLRLRENGRDELSRLTMMLNQLLAKLEQSQYQLSRAKAELEDRVEQRTSALTRINEKLIAEMDDRHRIEAQLRSSEADLRLYAEELESTLQQLQETQAQLLQSEKMSALGQLVAGVAHEINNPISFIQGNLTYACQYTEELLSLLAIYQEHSPTAAINPLNTVTANSFDLDFLTTDFPKLLGSMQSGVDRIQTIVQSLRSFSRLDEADYKQVDLHEGLDSALLILQHRLQPQGELAEGIKVIKDYGKLPPIECYAGQLNQVFMHLLSNAIDALVARYSLHATGGHHASDSLRSQGEAIPVASRHCTTLTTPSRAMPSIHIQTRYSNRQIEICIVDNGMGIPPEVQTKVFDPFFTTKPVGAGTGLGLSVSYQIIDRHGGQLKCSSTSGVGTEFVIELPLRSKPLAQS